MSAGQKADLDRQLERLGDYAAANGYSVAREVREAASDLNDHRPQLSALLADPSTAVLNVEHRVRLTR